MQVQVNKLSPVLIEFDVQVAADRVSSEMEKAYTAVSKSARIRGFRPGKAPRGILRNMFGARIAADVAQRLVDETFPQAVSKENVQPVNSPAIEPQPVEENKPFSYKARFEIVPFIESVKYDGLEAKRPKIEVKEEQIAEELERLRREHSTLEPPKTERGAAKGDQVTIDFSIEVDGKVIEDAGATDFPSELGAGVLLGPIDEALTGKKVGDAAEASVEMPAQHPHPKLKGKTAVFKLTLKELKERVLPALDDEFAKDLGEFDTLADLKKDITTRIEKQLKENADNAVAEQLVVELVKANPIPLPPSLVERQMQLTQQEIMSQARRQGQSVSGLGDELRQKIQADSEVKVRAGLLMAEIAKKESIKIGDAEIEEGLAELAEQSGKNVAKLRAEYRDPKKREMLIGMILENKVLDIIEAKAKIEDEPGKSP
ncbi:MAG: trigger factor [Myxococcales bacterium]|nr:trigger factor [Myxococcales bacterium]